MRGRAEILGHAIHPMLIVFPLGLLGTSVIFDIAYRVTSNPTLAVVGYWLIVSGIVGGLIAAVFGVIDWTGIPSGTRARTIGLIHGLTNVITVLLFAVSWYLRSGIPGDPPMTATILSVIGLVLALVGGWLGGELVERLGISVHEGANVNAPSSLYTENANATVPIKKM